MGLEDVSDLRERTVPQKNVVVESLSPTLFATPWTVARQAPLSMGFSRQEYWRGLPFPPPGDLPDPGIELDALVSPALAGGFFPAKPQGQPPKKKRQAAQQTDADDARRAAVAASSLPSVS